MDILQTIGELEGESPRNFDVRNSDPYRLVFRKNNDTIVYYFSCPVYEKITKKLLRCAWEKSGRGVWFQGVNARIEVVDGLVVIENEEGRCEISFEDKVNLLPAFNGIFVETERERIAVKAKFDFAGNVLANGNFFALTKEIFPPFLVANCLYAEQKGSLFPLEFEYRVINDREFIFDFHADKADKLYFDINLYLPKLMFDTTVSSKKKRENNVYGEVAFLGKTGLRGKEWLYTRIDVSKMSDIKADSILDAFLLLPVYGGGNDFLKLNELNMPWCSFGTTWENKNTTERAVCFSEDIKNYKKLEVTHLIKRILKTGEFRNSSLLLRRFSDHGCTVVATGDNYIDPQMIKLRIKGDLLDGND